MNGWYWPFYIEGAIIIPFILICLFASKDKNKLIDSIEEDQISNLSL